MGEWKECKFKDFMQFNPTEKLSKGTIAKKVDMDKIQPFNKKITGFYESEYNGGTKFKNNDTIMARITPCLENGKTAFVDIFNEGEIAFGSTEYIVLREIIDLSDSKFIYYLVTSEDFRDTAIQLMTGTSGRQRVETDALKERKFSFPPLKEQQAIAEVLSSLDDKIDLLNRQNKTLEALAETYFRQWFIEEAKDDWKVGKLGNFINISSGKGLKQNDFKENGAYSVLGANGEIGRCDNFLIDDKILVMGRVGTHGKILRISKKVWVSDNAFIMKPKKNIYYYYVYFILKTLDYESLNVGSTQPLITQTEIKKQEFLFLENLLIAFDEIVQVYFNKINWRFAILSGFTKKQAKKVLHQQDKSWK